MPFDPDSVQALKNMIAEVDLLISTTTPLPENRTARALELLGVAQAITDDLLRLDHRQNERTMLK